jgi:hypothetical protein
MGVISSRVISTTEAWDWARWATKFLKELKNRRVDREGNPFPLYYFNLLKPFTDS